MGGGVMIEASGVVRSKARGSLRAFVTTFADTGTADDTAEHRASVLFPRGHQPAPELYKSGGCRFFPTTKDRVRSKGRYLSSLFVVHTTSTSTAAL